MKAAEAEKDGGAAELEAAAAAPSSFDVVSRVSSTLTRSCFRLSVVSYGQECDCCCSRCACLCSNSASNCSEFCRMPRLAVTTTKRVATNRRCEGHESKAKGTWGVEGAAEAHAESAEMEPTAADVEELGSEEGADCSSIGCSMTLTVCCCLS